ncbi:MAG TPA: ABC transporter permease [Candidatus Angelobacter sp.]|jgi:NitT/TauT family transport system permease protein|nr:ABC transporter permease [Candidatus Angelobacter sp.]
MKRWESLFWPALVAATGLTVWALGVRLTHTSIFPSPVSVYRGLVELVSKGLLWRYIADSLFRVGSGFGLALVTGVPLGIVLGYYPVAFKTINPVIQIMRPISPLAWIPLSIVWFGVGNLAAVFLIFLAAFFPLVMATINGVRNIPEIYLRAGHNFGLSPAAVLSRVMFPAALPQILIGLRISLGVAWLVVVAAEMIAVDSGLGYLIIDSRNAGKRYDLVVAGMLLIGVIGLGLDTAIARLDRLNFIRRGKSL